MAVELGKFVSEQLRRLPKDHPDRAFLKGIHQVTEGYLRVSPPTVDTFTIDMSLSNQDSSQELRERDVQWLEDQRAQGLLPETFGKRLAFYRERLGIKQVTLAERLGIEHTYFNRIENDNRKLRNPDKIILAARELLLPKSHTIELIRLAGYSPEVVKPASQTEKELLTTKEAADYLKVHPKTIYRYVKNHGLQQRRIAGISRPRFLKKDLDALLEGDK